MKNRSEAAPVFPTLGRRQFVAVGLSSLAAIPVRQIDGTVRRNFSTNKPLQATRPFELEELTIVQLAEGLNGGTWTSQRLVEIYLARIRELDRNGPAICHMLDLNSDAPRLAADLDRERQNGRLRGPLHGIPVVLKDNIDTGDGMTTTAGSLALEGSRAPRDAHLVTRLRAAGAVILGKTSMSEWANFRSPRSSSGWCSRGGQGRNPYALDRSPCGSSSGTGGAVAACFAAAGVGTETDGSVTCPSSHMALVGIKPTVGLVSRRGIIPISASQDTAGPMARTVTDAAMMLSALAGPDPEDPATLGAPDQVDYTRFLEPGALRGRRLGIPRKVFTGYHDGTDRLFEAAVQVLRGLGAEIIEPTDFPHASDTGTAENLVLLYEFKAGLNSYLASLGPGAPVRSLKEIIAFNDRERPRVMPYFGQETFIEAERKGDLASAEYRKALRECRRLWRREGIDLVMDRHRLDALIAPTGNPPWPIDLINGDHFIGSVTTPAAVAGYPHVSVPGGWYCGLPVGVSFFGRAWSEGALLGMAFDFEQATRHRKAPVFLPTAPVEALGRGGQ